MNTTVVHRSWRTWIANARNMKARNLNVVKLHVSRKISCRPLVSRDERSGKMRR